MPPPPLAVVGRREQPVDHLLVGVGGLVRRGRRRSPRARGQADQVEGHAPDQGAPVGLGRRREALGLQRRQDEPIDRILRPGAVPDFGGLGGPDRPEAPVLRARLEVEGPASSFAADFGRSSPGQGAPMSIHRVRTAISLAGQLRLGGHLIEVAVVDRVDQQALPRLARHDRRPGAAAGQGRGARVEAEVPLLLRRRRGTPGSGRRAAVGPRARRTPGPTGPEAARPAPSGQSGPGRRP